MDDHAATNLEQHLKNSVDSFTLDSALLDVSHNIRLDASHYNPFVANAIKSLKQSGMDLRKLGSIVESVFIPPRVKRAYVTDREYGIPFLQGSHVVHFKPADLKYISKKNQKAIDKLIIKSGWILVTRSGSTGRVAMALKAWDGWAASEHIFRIVPNEKECLSGYLYAFLSSSLGQAQLNSSIYGAVVDELTEDHIRNIVAPIPKTGKQLNKAKKIDAMAKRALQLKDEAVKLDDDTVDFVSGLFGNN